MIGQFENIDEAYQAYCNLVYSLLLSNCPVDTGNMITHIRYNNDGETCKIIIDTVPYSVAPKALKKRIKKYGPNYKEVEYAAYTEYPRKKGINPNEGWIRNNSIYVGATCITPNVKCEIDL